MRFDFSDDIKWLYREYGEKAEFSGTIELLKRKQDEYNNVLMQLTKVIEDRDKKIEELINEKVNYRDLYEQTKKELDQLKDTNICYNVINRLIQQVKDTQAALSKVEGDNNKLKARLWDMSETRSSSIEDLQKEIKDLKNRLGFTLNLLNKLLKI